MPELRAEHLQKKYKTRQVVKDASLEISQGKIVGLLGPNGAGKTTSFYMMVGLVKPDSGDVYLEGKNISHLEMHERARLGIGYLPQETSIYRKMTVGDNILATLELRDDLSKKQRLEIQAELLKEFRIEHLKEVMAYSLSGGEKRRVEVARALARNLKFMLLDEPFAGVDPISVLELKETIIHLRDRNIGILITDHNVRDTLAICDFAYIVNQGTIIAAGTPAEILANKQVREVYLGHDFNL